jgi:hypothetical protein
LFLRTFEEHFKRQIQDPRNFKHFATSATETHLFRPTLFFFYFVKMSTNITPIISCNVDENGEFSPYNALDSGKVSNMLVVNQREGQPPALDANGNEEFFIGNVNYGRGMLTWGHYPDLGRPEVQKWWGDQYKVSTPHSH